MQFQLGSGHVLREPDKTSGICRWSAGIIKERESSGHQDEHKVWDLLNRVEDLCLEVFNE